MATVNLSPIGNGQQFFLTTGLPNNGGFLNTYAAGTTTPVATYTDSAGTTQNPVSIQLGTDGRPPSEIWIVQGTAVKFVLTDSLLNPIADATYDNIVGINDSSASGSALGIALAASSGSSLVGFIQSGTGAVATTVQAILRGWVTPQMFGSVGTSDDSTVVQAANDNAEAKGTAVYFPADTVYKLNNVNQTVPWYSHGAVLKPVGGASMDMIVQGGASYTTADIELSGFTFVVTDVGSTYSIGCVRVHSCRTTRIQNNNFIDGNFYDIYAAGGTDEVAIGAAYINNNYFSSTTGNDIQSWAGHLPIEWRPQVATGATTRPCKYIEFIGNYITGYWVCKFQATDHVYVDSTFIQTGTYSQFGSSSPFVFSGNGVVVFEGQSEIRNTFGYATLQSDPGGTGMQSWTADRFYWRHTTYFPTSAATHVNLSDVDTFIMDSGYINQLNISTGDKTLVDISGVRLDRIETGSLASTSYTISEFNISGCNLHHISVYDSTWTGYITKSKITGNNWEASGSGPMKLQVQQLDFNHNSINIDTGGTPTTGSLYIYSDNSTDGKIKINQNTVTTDAACFVYATNCVNIQCDENLIRGATGTWTQSDIQTSSSTIYGIRHNTVNGVDYNSGTANPVGAVTPRNIGDRYFKTDSKAWYIATGTTSSDWTSAIS